jgi:formylglycine-generating enzyme required for sulfatase activity
MIPRVLLGLALAAMLAMDGTPQPGSTKPRAWILGDMVEIPGGTFAMGSDSPEANDSEKPVHSVTVKGFRLDKTEVNVMAYALCVRAGACREPDAYRNQRGNYHAFCNWKHPEKRLSHPINCVDFQQASAFCSWAHKRLPTEEEWEYAARGGSESRTYPWGNDKPDQSRLNACGSECSDNLAAKRFPRWTPLYETSDGWPETAPVGSFPAGASKHGVLDLAGNVWEWTASEYARYDGSHAEKKRVLRGGSWGGGDARTERTTNRFRLVPDSNAQFLGFRCAQDSSGGPGGADKMPPPSSPPTGTQRPRD